MPQDSPCPLLDAALATAERGWKIFPIWRTGKRPAVRAWEQRATTDVARIFRCWAASDFNVGIATGPSKLVVIDLDVPKHDQDLPPAGTLHAVTTGADALAKLAADHEQPFPGDTYTVRTASGGTHLYFAAPQDVELRNTVGALGWKIDTRAAGGCVVGAGSVVNGKPYTCVNDVDPAPLPLWLVDLLRPMELPPQEPVTVTLGSDRRSGYLKAAVDGELAKVANSPEHEHNNALYLAAIALGQLVAGGELSGAEVTEWLVTAALRVGQGEREARRTVASGLKTGARRPRTVTRRSA
ncbi:bifunctional DNA primase/polymerase [Streptomyces sp. I05A-00742]|uniref:bifunctional DNA primase/polymerase n=1 Tax=Streptomyces sp. I05A-00742 TaxID=2732853 RepID=UPI00148790AB|nr:bifunctional DNA primase/polymerase [Streptomyces sp. I05A-00742]